jgi:hypothetical protein
LRTAVDDSLRHIIPNARGDRAAEDSGARCPQIALSSAAGDAAEDGDYSQHNFGKIEELRHGEGWEEVGLDWS